MSDTSPGRYRLLYPRIWRDPKFARLTKSARELALYLLTGPQTNRIGLFYFSIGTASEDLNVSVETLRKGLADVAVAFGWTFDSRARVLFIPSWWRWNPPANANVLKGNLKDLSEIPPCALVDAFARNLVTLDLTLHETFVEGCRIRIREHSPTQYQDQKPFQEQEHIPALRARAVTKGAQKGNEPVSDVMLSIAQEATQFITPSTPLEEIIDAINHVAKGKGMGLVKRGEAIAAINAITNGSYARQA